MSTLTRPDGATLFHEEHGDPAADAIVLLEGMGGDIPGWRRSIPHLAAELWVVAYDFRGNGRSSEPTGPVTMSTFVEDTVALLDDLGLARAHVYGQSFGGMVAQELALAHPDRVRTLVLAATHCGGSHVVPAPRTGEQPRHPGGGRRQREAMRSFDSYARLPLIIAPTLVLHGTDDRVISPANAEVLAGRIPGAELVLLEGAGHLYHSEQAEAVDAAVLDFVRRRR